MEVNETLQIISPIHWCSHQEANTLHLCQGANNIRCGVTKRPPPKAPPDSRYQYDYSNYNFDVVTIEVNNESIV